MSGHADHDTKLTLAEALGRLSGKQLSSVEFVQDYVQLRFDGPCLTAYIAPVVESEGKRFGSDVPGYRDQLCRRIGSTIVSAAVREGMAASLHFSDGASITISLRDEDYKGPEALQFVDEAGRWVA